MTEWWKQRHDAVEKVFAGESQFIECIRPYLSDDQLSALARVHDLRLRQRARAIHAVYPASNLDLSEELFLLNQRGLDMQAREHSRFEADVLRYEVEATNLFRRALRVRQRPLIEGNELNAQLALLRSKEPDEAKRLDREIALRSARRQIYDEIADVDMAIHDLNRRYVERFAELLSRETADILRTGFRETAYGLVYPNPFDIGTMLKAAHSMEDLDDDQVALIGVLHDEYQRRQNELSEKMVEVFLEWCEHLVRVHGYEFAAYRDYQPKMARLQQQRLESAQRVLSTLEGVLGPDAWAKLEKHRQAFQTNVDAFELLCQQLEQKYRRWPGPTDRELRLPVHRVRATAARPGR